MNSKIATVIAPKTKKNRVPWRPNDIYLLKIWIIKIGLNNPIIETNNVRMIRIPNDLLSLNILNQ